ncbi:UDP-N-acetylmuramate dehydrogenase [Clostridium aestuarii]|uniref:UDP-N-acetylenolpyruvoylglucosamine reductase n=1 Tax=Clostridium aestuarii TaxID=338193 RepID=A0ABT4CWC9_9CLOT|nr:UDP-N-acetylmuramate dehydrogenase [Clostridium aestuarii]MCY6483294.1 UDP-N-acetylmuramate dehydrogenase [Clostridium aestuarii]
MVQDISVVNKFKDILDENDIKVNALMKKYTSFKVGGPADILVTPTNYEQVKEIINFCKKNSITYYVIGNGTNLVVRDGGIRGVVINLSRLDKLSVDGEILSTQAGALLSSAAKLALKHSLKGLEFANGIPGSVGGAVAMNAGAYNGEISQVIESVLIIDNNGQIRKISKDELELNYRMSAVLKFGYIVLEATFKLEKGDYETIKNRINDLTRRRKEKQPLEYPSAGSTFKRPEGYFAGKLIQDCGLKGTSVGGAEVSVKHSGFIINKNNATAKDIMELIAIVQKKVKEQYGVNLNPEVRIVGEEIDEV